MANQVLLEQLKGEVEKHLKKEFLNQRGRVLSSPLSTLKMGSVYLVGKNPSGRAGQSEAEVDARTVGQNLERLGTNEEHPFLHESWDQHQLAGGDAIQLRACWLFKYLNIPMENVCTSNGVFLRTGRKEPFRFAPNEQPLENYELAFKKCWPVHKFILKQLGPRVIVTYGKWVRDAFFRRLSPAEAAGNRVCNCDARPFSFWKKGRFEDEDLSDLSKVVVFGIPHLSMYTPDSCVMEGLKREIESGKTLRP